MDGGTSITIAEMPASGADDAQAVIAGKKQRVVERPPSDHYPSPPEATRALLSVERFAGGIWECCAGRGDMAAELRMAGYTVAATTIEEGRHERAFPKHMVTGGVDVLKETRRRHDTAITNPPYKLTEEIIRHLICLGCVNIAMLLNIKFLSSEGRSEFFEKYPPANIWVFRDRITMYPHGYEGPKGSTTETFAWFVWRSPFHSRPPQIGWITAKHFRDKRDDSQA
jgi:hypothetical protein